MGRAPGSRLNRRGSIGSKSTDVIGDVEDACYIDRHDDCTAVAVSVPGWLAITVGYTGCLGEK